MKASELIQAMTDAGAPMDAILIALREIEAREDAIEQRRAADRERKRRQRGTVTGQSRDTGGTVTVTPSLSLPPNENNSNPPTHTHPDMTTRARKADPFPCPDGVDPVDWDGLQASRKAQRKPMTDGAYRQICKKLKTWGDAGWPPGPIVATAAERGWLTVFETDEMKGQGNGRSHNDIRGRISQGPDRRSSLARAIDEGLDFLGGSQAQVS